MTTVVAAFALALVVMSITFMGGAVIVAVPLAIIAIGIVAFVDFNRRRKTAQSIHTHQHDDDVEFTLSQRVARWTVGVLNPFFQIKSLHDFNAKFDPEWLPRVLAYRRRTDLPRVGLRYAGAEGFLALPVIGDLLVPKTVGGVSSPSAPPSAQRAA